MACVRLDGDGLKIDSMVIGTLFGKYNHAEEPCRIHLTEGHNAALCTAVPQPQSFCYQVFNRSHSQHVSIF